MMICSKMKRVPDLNVANQNDEVRMYLNLGLLLSKYINVSLLALQILLRNKLLILSLKFTNRSHCIILDLLSFNPNFY